MVDVSAERRFRAWHVRTFDVGTAFSLLGTRGNRLERSRHLASSAPGAFCDTNPGPARHRRHTHHPGIAPRVVFCRHRAHIRIGLLPPRNRSRPPAVRVNTALARNLSA